MLLIAPITIVGLVRVPGTLHSYGVQEYWEIWGYRHFTPNGVTPLAV